MNQTSSGRMPVKLGPLALLLTVISICLTTMAILTFATARADRRLAEKYAATVRLRYELDQAPTYTAMTAMGGPGGAKLAAGCAGADRFS